MIFATCEVQPNYHISAAQQEDVRGRINLWQRRDGQGPLMVHAKLSGFKVKDHVRNTRESLIVPIETPLDDNVVQKVNYERGFHVHVNGELSQGCESTGSHYNPTQSLHGGPLDSVRHVGDLGNIRCDSNGEIDTELTYPKVSLAGDHSILGRSLVVS